MQIINRDRNNIDTKDRVAIFIDGSNLYHALKNQFGHFDLNFAAFAQKLCGPRRLLRTYYYNVLQDPSIKPDGHQEQQAFLEYLRDTPYLEVRLGTTKTAQGVQVEKGVDIMLATDMLYLAFSDRYDVAILVSGDADFVYALQTIKNLGKHVEIAHFENAASRELLYIADNRHLLDKNFLGSIWARKQPFRKPQAARSQIRNSPKSPARPVL